jgi:hypothetical protein
MPKQSVGWKQPVSRRKPCKGGAQMSFKILLLSPDVDSSWPEKIRRAVPGILVKAFRRRRSAVGTFPSISDNLGRGGVMKREFA